MKNLKPLIAVTVFTAMAALSSCTKDNVAPVKAAAITHNFARHEALADSTGDSGGQENPKLPPNK